MDELFLPGTEPKELCKGCNGVEVFNKKFDRMDKLDKKDVLMDASKSDILPKLESKDSIFENQ
jgi:hypothetical protein